MPRQLVAVGVVLLLGIACQTAFDAGGMHNLPPAPPGATNFSDYKPDRPYLPTTKGVVERSVYTTKSDEGYDIEVRDILVSPKQPEAEVAIAGATILEVRQGSGKATVGEGKMDLRPGTVFTVGEKEQLWLTAQGEPLALRIWIVSPGERP